MCDFIDKTMTTTFRNTVVRATREFKFLGFDFYEKKTVYSRKTLQLTMRCDFNGVVVLIPCDARVKRHTLNKQGKQLKNGPCFGAYYRAVIENGEITILSQQKFGEC